MKIKIKRKHIIDGEPESSLGCPIALALQEYGISNPDVGRKYVELGKKKVQLPESAQEFIKKFDDGSKVQPFSFEL